MSSLYPTRNGDVEAKYIVNENGKNIQISSFPMHLGRETLQMASSILCEANLWTPPTLRPILTISIKTAVNTEHRNTYLTCLIILKATSHFKHNLIGSVCLRENGAMSKLRTNRLTSSEFLAKRAYYSYKNLMSIQSLALIAGGKVNLSDLFIKMESKVITHSAP